MIKNQIGFLKTSVPSEDTSTINNSSALLKTQRSRLEIRPLQISSASLFDFLPENGFLFFCTWSYIKKQNKKNMLMQINIRPAHIVLTWMLTFAPSMKWGSFCNAFCSPSSVENPIQQNPRWKPVSLSCKTRQNSSQHDRYIKKTMKH